MFLSVQAVLVFDVSQPATLEKVHSWVEELENHSAGAGNEEEVVLVVAGNKADLRDSRPDGSDYVDSQAANRYAATISQWKGTRW
jgi:GTPase SAR1 family protein